MTARVFSWDWREQPGLAAIAVAEMTDEQAWRLYSGEDEEG